MGGATTALISRSNSFQIQNYIPISWTKPIISSQQALPAIWEAPQPTLLASQTLNPTTPTLQTWDLQEEGGSLADSSKNPICFLIDSIRRFGNQGHLSKAFTAYNRLQLHAPSSYLILRPISSLLWCCTTLKAISQGTQLHAHIISLGFMEESALPSRLVSFYVAFDLLADARAIAEGSSISRHCLLWNVLISAYVRTGFFGDALCAFKSMVMKGVRVDNFTYPSVLKACGEMQDLDLGREVHKHIGSSGLEWNLFVKNALISMYAKCGALDIARIVFEEMPERDTVSWNSMISGYASKGMWDEAFKLFEQMRIEDLELNIVTWNTIAGGNLQMGNHMKALQLISQMKMHGSVFDFVTVIIGLGACSRIGSIKLGKEIHGSTIRTFCDGHETIRNALITMYSRCKNTKCAYLLFQMADVRSLVTWNCMITGFALSDLSENASLMFRDLLWSGVQPNYVTVVTILSLCARVANLQHGKELHCYITKHRFGDYRLLWNSLVDMYSKSGRISEARRVFNLMRDRDEVSYTSLIAGYGMQGEGLTALKLFDEMNKIGIKPDHITMVAVLSACSHSGLVVEGQMLFDRMVGLYGIIPRLEHFACMVDLFGRAGLLSKAEEVLNRMSFRPTTVMWATLVGACRVHKNTEIGERAATRLLELRPDNPGHYVMIANMYASAGCWKELAKVRMQMRDSGIRKAPGCAWVDLGNGFYPFLVGDRENPHVHDIYSLLGGLGENMKDAGYVGNEKLGFDEEIGRL